MKKTRTIWALIASAVIALSLVAFTGCGDSAQKLSFKSAFDCSVLGGISLLNAGGSTAAPSVRRAAAPYAEAAADSETARAELTDAEKDRILANLAIAENTLGGDVVKSEVKASEREGYEWTYTLTAATADGGSAAYEFHYNATVDEEDEEESVLDGIAIFDGVEYAVHGEREVESEEGEYEEEYKFRITLDENNYVVIEQEMSVEDGETEHEFKYTEYKNGEKVYETKVEYEVEDDGEIELKFKTETADGETEYKFEMYTENDTRYIKVKLEDGSGKIKARIKVTADEDGDNVYEFVA